MKSSKEIRNEFIDFFIKKGHTEVISSPLIPIDDNTLLFANAGMNQFKDVFLGTGKRDYTRATNSQKCIRAGGKHNDLDEVGKDDHHLSFFEMLGNWSFGDYYKKEAITWAWELLTEVWKLPKDKLHATVYTTDDEAEELWKEVTDIEPSRITRHEDDNFWAMGETGPCGPCSEIHYDRGEAYCNKKHIPGHVCAVNGDCDRIIEIWNLVFIQYNRDEEGNLTPLPATHVDTGMGFERVSMVLQGVDSNYHIDIMQKIIDKIAEMSDTPYVSGSVPHRVIADHARALLFAISDGGLPSNDGRGYVLRRILRRASRYGLKLGMDKPFIYKIFPTIVEAMGEMYPEIERYLEHASNIVKAEETSFLRTLSKGVELFNSYVEEMRVEGKTIVPGDVVFKLYDTYGFPVDLTKQMAEELDLSVDDEGFETEMAKQKEKSKKAQKFRVQKVKDWIELTDVSKTEFCGYDTYEGESKIVKYFIDDKSLKLVLEKSLFYAESGGQVSDKGYIEIEKKKFDVIDVQKDGEYIVVSVKVKESLPPLDKNTVVHQYVDKSFRDDCRIHHSATHLLQSAIKKVLGEHIAQSGSYVDNKSLRFDYSHFEKMTAEQIAETEKIVNEHIRKNYLTTTEVMSLDDAKKKNVTALFGEKYGDVVRVVSMGEFSSELCGGTHVKYTGDIGYFRIISESSIAAGIRRIEAVCGNDAVMISRNQADTLSTIRELFNCKEEQLLERTKKLFEEKKELDKKIEEMKQRAAQTAVLTLLSEKKDVNGISVVAKVVDADDAKILKSMGEALRDKLVSGIGLLGANIDGKASLVCVVTDDLKNTYKAGTIISGAAKLVKGGGGGAPHIATAGGKDGENIDKAVGFIFDFLNKGE